MVSADESVESVLDGEGAVLCDMMQKVNRGAGEEFVLLLPYRLDDEWSSDGWG